jgi:predicted Ser/Thr protein kinase
VARFRSALAVAALLAGPAAAQTQPTFYAAYEDGLEAQGQGQWHQAIACLERAVKLRPAPAARVIIYGNNLLTAYYPYHRLALCHLELGEWEAAAAALRQSEAWGEPAPYREPLHRRLLRAQEARPRPEPPAPAAVAPAPEPRHPPAAAEGAEGHGPANPIPAAAGQPPPPLLPARLPAEPGPGARPQDPARPEPEPARAAAPGKPEDRPAVPAPQPVKPLPRGLWGVPVLAAAFGLWAWRRRRNPEPPEPAIELPDPKRIGPYQVLRLLGHGGFATTYLARHSASGQEVAVKVLHPHRLRDPDFRRRFALEAKLGAMLDHPRLVRLLDPGPAEGGAWLAMEYVPGPTLQDWLKQHGALPVAEAVAIALGIAEAMAYAHSHGVVHRDLKPGNVILAKAGVKVMDLGIARDMDAPTVTTTYAFLGTPLYGAPEAQLLARAGPAVDRYSLGAILFEMLAGRPPYAGETPFAIMEQHRAAPVPDITDLRELPPDLARLLMRLLAKDPEQRPEDGELVARLKRIREQL